MIIELLFMKSLSSVQLIEENYQKHISTYDMGISAVLY